MIAVNGFSLASQVLFLIICAFVLPFAVGVLFVGGVFVCKPTHCTYAFLIRTVSIFRMFPPWS